MTCAIFTMPANHESKLWELFPLHPHHWTASIPLLFWEQGDFIFPLLFFLTFFFLLFLSNQLSADHPSHFSLCPRILWTIVLIPSVLSIKALVILLGTAGRSGSTHRHSFCGTVWLQLRWTCAYFKLLPVNAFHGVPQGCTAECPDATNWTMCRDTQARAKICCLVTSVTRSTYKAFHRQMTILMTSFKLPPCH